MYFLCSRRTTLRAFPFILLPLPLVAHEAWMLTPSEIDVLAEAPMPALFTSTIALSLAAMIGIIATVIAGLGWNRRIAAPRHRTLDRTHLFRARHAVIFDCWLGLVGYGADRIGGHSCLGTVHTPSRDRADCVERLGISTLWRGLSVLRAAFYRPGIGVDPNWSGTMFS